MRSHDAATLAKTMLMHRELAEYHRAIAEKTSVALKYSHHADLAFRLNREADDIQDMLVAEEENQWQNP